jgi:hypothetical protein
MKSIDEAVRRIFIALSMMVTLIAGVSLGGWAQEQGKSQSNAARPKNPTHYTLAATPDNVQWGWYDPNEKPKLTIHSGDSVSIESICTDFDRG